MIAVCDMGPLHYLVLIRAEHVLPQLFDRVVTARVVIEKEMSDPNAPDPVRRWAASPPPWLGSYVGWSITRLVGLRRSLVRYSRTTRGASSRRRTSSATSPPPPFRLLPLSFRLSFRVLPLSFRVLPLSFRVLLPPLLILPFDIPLPSKWVRGHGPPPGLKAGDSLRPYSRPQLVILETLFRVVKKMPPRWSSFSTHRRLMISEWLFRCFGELKI